MVNYVKIDEVKKAALIFLSYSSKDQEVAGYMTIDPNFARVVIPLINHDWTDMSKYGYSLSFDVTASEPLSSLTLKMKKFIKETGMTFATEKISVGAKIQ